LGRGFFRVKGLENVNVAAAVGEDGGVKVVGRVAEAGAELDLGLKLDESTRMRDFASIALGSAGYPFWIGSLVSYRFCPSYGG
jgi:hypothetical protein